MKNQSTNCSICKANLNDGKLFTCTKCDKKCHQLCLLYTDEEIKNFNITRCDVCRTIENLDKESQETREKLLKEIKCHFCGKNDGLLKKLKEKKDKWTHVNCIKWFTYVRLEIENGFTIFRTDKNLPGSIWTEECSSCKKTVKGDFFIKCNKPQCEKYIHTKCIQNSYVEEIKSSRIFYNLYHCEEHKSAKKSGSVFSEVKTYGKSININTNGNTSEAPQNIKVLKDFEESKMINQDIILKTFKPVIINDEENNINKLKIKMKFTDETCSSNGSVNGIKLHTENFIKTDNQIKTSNNTNNVSTVGNPLKLTKEKNQLHSANSIPKRDNDLNKMSNEIRLNPLSYSVANNTIKNNQYTNTYNTHCNQIDYSNSNINKKNLNHDTQNATHINISSIPNNHNNISKNKLENNMNFNSSRCNSSTNTHIPFYPMDEEEEGDFEFVFSYVKCDICAKRLDLDDKEKIKQCNNCLTYYHSFCAKDFGDKLDSDFCRKCQSDKTFEENCFVCGKYQGSMIKCDNNWVHVFCMVMLKNYFYKKHDHMFNWGLDKYKVPKAAKVCMICKTVNTFTIKCPYCDLTYHPYCGLNSNFDFYSIDKKVNGVTDLLNKLEISCTCENHNIFLHRPSSNKLIKLSEKSSAKNLGSNMDHNMAKECFFSPEVNGHLNSSHCGKNKSIAPNTYQNNNSKIPSKLNKPMIKCKLSSLNVNNLAYPYTNLISSINIKNLKKYLSNKIDFNCCLKFTEWSWDTTDYFFIEVDEKLLACLGMEKKEPESNYIKEDDIKEIIDEYVSLRNKNSLKINSHMDNDISDHVICEFKNKKVNCTYIAIYNTSRLSEIKLNSNYFNFMSDLNNFKENENFSFLSKRRRSESTHNICYTNTNFIFSKNLKLIEDDEEISTDKKEIQKNSNSSEISSNFMNSTNSTRVKFIIEDIDAKSNTENINNMDIDMNFSEYRLTNSLNSHSKFNSSKFLRKLKFINSFKLRRKDRHALFCEEASRSKIFHMLKENNLSFSNLEDIDSELLIKNQMLQVVRNKNRKIIENLKKKISMNKYDNDNIDRETILNFPRSDLFYKYRTSTKWAFIKRRLILGVQPKSVEEILKNKGQNYNNIKSGKINNNEEGKDKKSNSSSNINSASFMTSFINSYEELKSIESECCVCFYSDLEDTTPIVFCDSCNVSVHPLCYGIKEIPEGDYFCDLCVSKNNKNNTIKNNSQNNMISNITQSHNNNKSIISIDHDQAQNFRNKKCVLCLNKNGALKRVDKCGEYWAHVTCILLSKNLNFKDFLSMDEVIGYKNSTYNIANDNINNNSYNNSKMSACYFCNNSSGDLFECAGVNNQNISYNPNSKITPITCHKYFHFFCAYLNGLQIKFEELDNRKLRPIIYCDMHIEEINFKQILQKELRVLTYHKEMITAIYSDNMSSIKNIYVKEKSKLNRTKEERNFLNKNEKIEKIHKFQTYKDELILNWEEIQIIDSCPISSNEENKINNNNIDYKNTNTNDLMKIESTETKLSKPVYSTTDDTKCAVCLSEFNYENSSMSSEIKSGEDLLITKCSKCHIRFHNICYHLETLSINASRILCDYCKLTTRFKIIEKYGECLLCPNVGGALKKCKNKKQTKSTTNNIQFSWIHVTCANYTKEIYLNNNCFEGFHLIRSEILNKYTCNLCNSNKGYTIKCCARTCKIKFHAYCAMMSNMQKEKIDENLVFYCRFHSNLYKDCCAKKEFDALSGENILSHDLIDLIENKQEICENFKQIGGMGYNDENSMMEDITVPSYVSNVIKYLSRKYRGEELFYNLLKIGV